MTTIVKYRVHDKKNKPRWVDTSMANFKEVFRRLPRAVTLVNVQIYEAVDGKAEWSNARYELKAIWDWYRVEKNTAPYYWYEKIAIRDPEVCRKHGEGFWVKTLQLLVEDIG